MKNLLASVVIMLSVVFYTPAFADLQMRTSGVVMDDSAFLRAAQKALYQAGWEVISAQGNIVVAKRWDSAVLGWNTPVNKSLQWDGEKSQYVYRAEVVRGSDSIIIRYLPSWGSTSEKMLHDLRKALAEQVF